MIRDYKSDYENRKEYYKQRYLKIKDKQAEYKKEYTKNNQEKIKESSKRYRENNQEKIKAIAKRRSDNRAFKRKHRDKIKNLKQIAAKYKKDKYQKEYFKNRKKTDPLFKLSINIRSRTGLAFKNKGLRKKSNTKDMLGCSFEEMREHLVSQFTDGMTLENYGEWHIDHIIPLSSAKSEKELISLAHYKNLQPLWAEDNLIKGNKIL